MAQFRFLSKLLLSRELVFARRMCLENKQGSNHEVSGTVRLHYDVGLVQNVVQGTGTFKMNLIVNNLM